MGVIGFKSLTSFACFFIKGNMWFCWVLAFFAPRISLFFGWFVGGLSGSKADSTALFFDVM